MKRESRLFSALGLGALLFATSTMSMAQSPGSSPSYGGRPGASTSTSSAPAPGTVTNQTTTTESTTVVPTETMVTETTTFEDSAPLADTGGEPWMFVLGGLTLAASALMFRRRLGDNA